MSGSILLIDDEASLQLGFKKILQEKGYQIIEKGHDALATIEICQQIKPDLVLVNLQSSSLEGIKISKIIAKENLAGGILIISSFFDKEFIEEAKLIGALGYILKTKDNETLIPNIEMCLNKAIELKKTKAELEKLTKKLEERKIIDKAKGILIKELNLTEEEAYTKIRKMSMDKRTTMNEVGKTIIELYC